MMDIEAPVAQVGPHISYRYNVNLLPEELDTPDNQQERYMIARELLIKFQMLLRHPPAIHSLPTRYLVIDLNKAYRKF